jgi:hypothetical protein
MNEKKKNKLIDKNRLKLLNTLNTEIQSIYQEIGKDEESHQTKKMGLLMAINKKKNEMAVLLNGAGVDLNKSIKIDFETGKIEET